MIHTGRKKISGQDALIFVHIPKTAGTTLLRIIERQFPLDQRCHISLYPTNRDEELGIERLRQLTPGNRQTIRCLEGHMPFGLHRFLQKVPRPLVVLRDPVERMISSHYFVLSLGKQNPHYLTYVKNSLEDFTDFMDMRNEVNLQTRYISGSIDIENPRPPYPPLPFEALDMAKKHLATQFEVVGLTERFDETLLLMRESFGFSNVFYVKRNITRVRPRKNEIPDETIEMIKRVSRPDMELYRFAKELFEQRIRKEGALFRRKVHVFRLLNRVYGMLWHHYQRLKQI
ncbi:MAG: hypothetical protein B5M55_02680 [Desulfococcus sp. 4484_242]|nr:MAG: hypothetical protein B5M55_02680 [Desulfococcus sp. 4484_242]